MENPAQEEKLEEKPQDETTQEQIDVEEQAPEEVADEEVSTDEPAIADDETADTEADTIPDSKVVDEEDLPQTPKEYDFQVGDTVIVSNRIVEDERTRVQKFEGIVIAQKGSGVSKTFTVRRIGVNEIGVEKIFPLYSPNVVDVEVKRAGKVRRSKLYYLRDRKGKAATYVKPRAK